MSTPSSPSAGVKSFRVWLRPLGDTCRVTVDGADNARWLISRLSQAFMFRKLKLVPLQHESSLCTFQVPDSSEASRVPFEQVLSRFSEVQLMREPE